MHSSNFELSISFEYPRVNVEIRKNQLNNDLKLYSNTRNETNCKYTIVSLCRLISRSTYWIASYSRSVLYLVKLRNELYFGILYFNNNYATLRIYEATSKKCMKLCGTLASNYRRKQEERSNEDNILRGVTLKKEKDKKNVPEYTESCDKEKFMVTHELKLLKNRGSI